jgi:hypothetical protein
MRGGWMVAAVGDWDGAHTLCMGGVWIVGFSLVAESRTAGAGGRGRGREVLGKRAWEVCEDLRVGEELRVGGEGATYADGLEELMAGPSPVDL